MHQLKIGRPRIAAPLLLALLGAAGCDDGRPAMDTSRTEARVTGTVKVQGKPAQGGGQIAFDPSNAERQVGAFVFPVGPDGTYSAKTFTGDNIVRFSGPMIKEHPELALATRYCPLAGGDNVLDFDLLGQGDQPRGPTYSQKKGGPRKR